MARPAPDPRAVVAVFEARKFVGLKYSEIEEWTRGHRPPERELDAQLPEWEWGPLPRATAHLWYTQALQWWLAHERLSPDEEYAGLRIGLDYAASEVMRKYQTGQLDVKTFAELTIKLGAEIRALTGAGRGSDEYGEQVTVSPRAAQAIDEMKARREQRERVRTRKGIG